VTRLWNQGYEIFLEMALYKRDDGSISLEEEGSGNELHCSKLTVVD
jgi:hypothetical protein